MEKQKNLEEIELKLKEAYRVSNLARKKGYDPKQDVEIPFAKDMAERVEGLISAAIPQIMGSGISKRIRDLEKKYSALDWRVALVVAEEVSRQKFCKFDTEKEAMEAGIRVGFAYLTLGTVSSPLEGFTDLKIGIRKDGKPYFVLYYSGPIRSAGGTGASVSVLIADYIRKKKGYDVYDPTEEEILRTITEVYDYHERINNLQYLPSEEEIRFLIQHLPVQINGDPSEKLEVSNYKDLKRVETNTIRNGHCLVVGECLAQKAPKLWKQISRWGKDFELDHWFFLEDFVKIQKKSKIEKEVKETKSKLSPDYTFIKDLVAGRPILTHPLRAGGFRLRYGRSRTSGYSSTSIHPLTMWVFNKYIATGTQLKLERPGKATVVSPCDTIEGPIVKLKDGTVVRLDVSQLKPPQADIVEILYVGDILINYGDFLNRAHPLVPAGYCEEWWIQELEKATVDLFGSLDLDKLSDLLEIPVGVLKTLLENPLITRPTAQAAIQISEKLKIPLHPFYTYHWKATTPEDILRLVGWLDKAAVTKEGEEIERAVLPISDTKRVLEIVGLPHLVASNEFVVIKKPEAQALFKSLNIGSDGNLAKINELIQTNPEITALEIVNILSGIKIKDKSGTFIGARMGRPEKAKMRKLIGSPHVLFPVGEQGGRMRSFQSAIEVGIVRGEFPSYFCGKCNKETIYPVCEICNRKTKKQFFCSICGTVDKDRCKHGQTTPFSKQTLDIKTHFSTVFKKLNTTSYPDLIKGVRGTSNKDHTPEHLLKGILRAKNNIYVNKDGTTRYDMTQMAITHFKPKEIKTDIETLKALGYSKDIHGAPLENENQVLEIFPQDVILPACQESLEEGADKVLFRVTKFIDEILEKLYELQPFYNLKSKEDLVGHLVLAIAPHTSAAITGRIIGFSDTQGFFAHPMFHAATRRDCDGDEASIILLLDALINFSRSYLPAHRGSTQDAPLVLIPELIPSEIDDMVFDLDIVWRYPLEFYQACLEYKQPWEVDIETLGKAINAEKRKPFGFTHPTTNFTHGVKCSSYKTLPTMEEKLKGQMELAEKIRAVDTADVARLVIEKHFLKDTKGQLRKFSMQQFRCVKCNEKYRRPPLIGKCLKCGGRIIFTISEGSVVKYLGPSISLAEKYNAPPYLKQTLVLLQRGVESVFGKEKDKQIGLGEWFG